MLLYPNFYFFVNELKKKMNVLHVFRICKIPDGTDTIAPSGELFVIFLMFLPFEVLQCFLLRLNHYPKDTYSY